MVNPDNVTKYNRSLDELLEFWLFCLFVRGKNATVQARKLNAFLESMPVNEPKTDYLFSMTAQQIDAKLRRFGVGQYNTLVPAIDETLLQLLRWKYFLKHATVDALIRIKGVGPKTARFFILHTQEGARVAALDTHVMRFLNLRLNAPYLSQHTPTSKERYKNYEELFLSIADREGVSPADMDLAIWRASRSGDPMLWKNFL